MAIGKVLGVEWANIASYGGVAKANIASLGGATAPVARGPIGISDVTTTTDTNRVWTTTSGISISLPSTAASGDFILLIVTSDDPVTSQRIAQPSGWSDAGVSWSGTTPDTSGRVFYRTLNGTEGSSVTVYATSNNMNRTCIGFTMIVDNVDTSSVVNAVGSAAVATAQSITAPAVTMSGTGNGLGFCVVAGDTGRADPYTFTNLTKQAESDAGGRHTAAFAIKALTGGANLSSETVSTSLTRNDGLAAIQFILNEA